MHEQDEDRDGDDGAAQALAPAAAHHGEPVAPGETPLMLGQTTASCRAAAIMPLPPARRPARGKCLRGSRDRPHCGGGRRFVLAGLEPQLFERAFGDEPAVGDDADAVGHALGDFKNVRGHDDGAAGAHAFAQDAFDLARGAGVEPGQRFVENDQPRLVNERAGQRHFLPHALGETFAAFLRMRRELEPVQKLLRARLGKRRREAPQSGDEFEILSRRELVVDHRLIGNPRHQPLRRNRIGERVDAGDADAAGVGPQQAGDHAQGRGLAGAVRAEQRIKLAGANIQVRARRPRDGRSA